MGGSPDHHVISNGNTNGDGDCGNRCRNTATTDNDKKVLPPSQ